MFSLELIRNQKEWVKEKLKQRNFDIDKIDNIFELDKKNRELKTNLENLLSERNKFSKEIGFLISKKEEIKTVVKDETRKIKFRDDSFVVDSGSRFADIVPEINLDADEFINAITEAIKAEINKKGVLLEDRKKENEQEEVEKLKRIAEAEKAARIQKELDEVKAEIVEFFVANKTNIDVIKPILALCKEHQYNNPNEIDTLDFAKEVLSKCK